MGSGFSKMKKQARQMQAQIEKMQEELKGTIVTGSAGGGLVTVTMNGDKEVKAVEIKPECVDLEDLEALQDLLIGAFNDAAMQLQSSTPSFPFSI